MASSTVSASIATLIIAILAVSRRYFVRIKRIASSCFLLEDYILVITVACFCAFTAIFVYISGTEQWGYVDVSTADMRYIWKYYYASLLLMDVVMTTIRLDLFLFYRRIYRRVNTSCRSYCIIFMILSVAYLGACILARTLFCGVSHKSPRAGFDFVIFSTSKCDDRGVRIGLLVGDLLLNIMVVSLVAKTVSILSISQRNSVDMGPIALLKEASKPCRPMASVAILSCIIPIVHLKFAAASDPNDYSARVKGLICSQVEACVFIFVSCMPMIRSLLFPGLVYPTSHPRNPRTRYASGSTASRSKSTGANAYRCVVSWALIMDDTLVSTEEKGDCFVIEKEVNVSVGVEDRDAMQADNGICEGKAKKSCETAAVLTPAEANDARSIESSDTEFENRPETQDDDKHEKTGLQPSSPTRR